MADVTVGFAGLSHLGIVSAAAAAEKGFRTIGYDADTATVAALTTGNPPVFEPDLPEILSRNRHRLAFTATPSELARCDIVYVARDVPTDDTGASDVSAITELIESVTPHVAAESVIVILCQVPPGFTREFADGDRRFHYQVETLIFGRAVERALHPERLIVGKPDADRPLPDTWRMFLASFDCPVIEMRLESAELCKISINMCLVGSIGVANTMAGICENVGADWAEILPALRLDARIGPNAYLKPGLGLAGGNLERDLATVRRIADAHGCDHGIVDAWIANSDARKDWAYRTLCDLVLDANPSARIAVLGLAYKENTRSVKNAASLRLLACLDGADVTVFDPAVEASSVAPAARAAASAIDAVHGADATVIVTPWPEFGALSPAVLAETMAGRVLIDPYGMIDEDEAVAAGFTYATLGTAVVRPAQTQHA